MSSASIGIIGGSGLYQLFPDSQRVVVETPFGAPSAPIEVSTFESHRIAFLPRHGSQHEFAPHLVNYKANVYALKTLGVHSIIGLNCAGSLALTIEPGDLVVCDDLIDYTRGRDDTYVHSGNLICFGMQNVFSPLLRAELIAAAHRADIKVHTSATAAVISGPRLSTRAESWRYVRDGCHVVNQTLYPECYLARELGLAYASATVVTDYDISVNPGAPISLNEMRENFHRSVWKLRKVVEEVLSGGDVPRDRDLVAEHRAAIVNGDFFGGMTI